MREVEADAPGRVNLIGEHTDYHGGLVMPCAIPQRTVVRLRPRSDRRVTASSAERPGEETAFDLDAEQRRRSWVDYVQGITWVLRDTGHQLRGFDLAVHSRVPVGSGLSSSAALEISLLRGLRTLFELPLDDIEVARLGQRAEVEFVGAPVGIMDQMACSLAGERDALYLDTRDLHFERLPLPPALELAVIDSGVAHDHASGDYVTRRRESFEAARLLGVPQLREVGEDRLPDIDALPPPFDRRARHIVSENARVRAAREALLTGALDHFGELLAASHRSLRDDYEVSVPVIDRLVALASADPRVYGARMTGGGFGGAIVIAARAGSARDVGEAVVRTARTESIAATLLVPEP